MSRSTKTPGSRRKAPVTSEVKRPGTPRKLDRDETERRLIAAFDRVWMRDGVAGLGVNAVLKEAQVGKALLYRYFGDIVGLAKAWARSESFLPDPVPQHTGVPQSPTQRHVSSAMSYARALRAKPRTRELLAVELLRSSPVTAALDEMRAQFGREMRAYVLSTGANEGEDAYALSFFVTAALTYLAIRADAVPDYYGLKLDRDADWVRIESMLERIVGRVLAPQEPTSRR